MIKIPSSALSQKRKRSLLNVVPLKGSSSCGSGDFSFAAVDSGLMNREIDLEPNFCQATISLKEH